MAKDRTSRSGKRAESSRFGSGRGAGGAGGGGGAGRERDFAPGVDDAVRVPLWLPVALYAVVTLVLFRHFVFSGEMLFGSDTLGLGYMARAFYSDALAGGTFPRWNPLLLGGTPFLESL
ncbi:MAG: hypothetical protein WDZ89_00620, partial [Gemmatimonadota bacterium]